jgi:hypothetical protein
MIQPYKFIIQAVVQEVEGKTVVGEQVAEPITVFGCEALEKWAREFPETLKSAVTKES